MAIKIARVTFKALLGMEVNLNPNYKAQISNQIQMIQYQMF